ncbi:MULTISPECIES: DUF29 domain-containing protein [unclassified Crocosphaera]|uniref:DUF29 domain-containing protein n=1 Tax=unclassified Crocosphaera TaxID=2623705 RepID=UPI0025803E18|nr:DUF29 domain-containing protein [Crocosphaera sp.]NQZ65324.1 DUF29 domain-containing protein [Crocosphaera sp.]
MALTTDKKLYDQDFYLWIEETVKQLKSGNFSNIDLDNLIEEVESLGKSQRKAVKSYLIRLLEHLLKRRYVIMFDCYRGWEIEIRNFRQRLKLELEDSPSLKNYIKEILSKSYQIDLENMIDSYPDTDFPVIYPFSDNIDELLNNKFWEN